MGKSKLLALAIVTMALALTSCGDSTSSSADNAMLFGKTPSVVASYNSKVKQLREDWKKSDSSSKKEDIAAEIESFKAKTIESVQKVAPEWSGSTIEVASDELFNIKTPVTVTFKDYFDDMEPRYTLDGEIVVAKEYAVDLEPNVIERNPNPSTAVMLYALDEQGEKLFNLQIGFAKVSIVEGRVVVPAGTVVKLEPIHMSDKRAAEYLQIKSLKLDFKKYTK